MRIWPFFLTFPFLAGCVGFGYPDITQTPRVVLPEPDVRAFKVTSEVTMTGPWMTGPVFFDGSVEEIPVAEAPLAPQSDAYFKYYYLVFPLNGSYDRSLSVLLYRRGYETVEIPARPWWQWPGMSRPEKVAWKQAPDLLAQKAAIEKIDLDPGGYGRSISAEVRQFLAQEYAHLADSPLATAPGIEETRKELLDLANFGYVRGVRHGTP